LRRGFRLPQGVEADALILAGDLCGRLSRAGLRFIESLDTDLPIVIIPGNHDYWNGSIELEIGRFRDCCRRPNTYVLDGEALEIAGTRIIGATLWTDYLISDEHRHYSSMKAGYAMSDIRRIRDRAYEWRLTPDRLFEEHQRQRADIERLLATPFEGPTAVVTHHAPSAQSLQFGGVTEDLDGAYASNLESLILRHQPELWLHGHVHRRRDYWLGDTRVFANPRGYSERFTTPRRLWHERTGWDPRLVLGTGGDRELHGSAGATIEHAIDRPGLSGPIPPATAEGLDADLAAEIEARRELEIRR
jgi:Icc-related predicted phosphoesterase